MLRSGLILAKLDAIFEKLVSIEAHLQKQGTAIMSDVTDLIAEVQAEKTVLGAATAAITGLIAQVEAANSGNDPRIAAVVADMRAQIAPLAEAIPANTAAAAPAHLA